MTYFAEKCLRVPLGHSQIGAGARKLTNTEEAKAMSLTKAGAKIKTAGDIINAELYNILLGSTKAMLLSEALRHLNQAFECLVEAKKID